jgi:hypothetical protein
MGAEWKTTTDTDKLSQIDGFTEQFNKFIQLLNYQREKCV